MSERWIRASEITTYLYCRRAWWLERVAGHAGQHVRELADGTAYHARHTRLVQRASWLQRLAYGLIFITVSVLVYALFTSLGT